MTNEKSNQERAKEYDQIIAMQKILLQTIFRNGVFISGKPITLDLNESQRVALNRVGVKVEKQQHAPKFKVNDKVVIVDHHEPLACREYWIVSGVHVGVIASSYRLVSEQGDILDCINEHQLEIYKVAAPKFKIGERVNVQESEGPWSVVDGRSNGQSYDYQLRNVAGVFVDWTSEKYLSPYVEPAPVPFLNDDTFKQGDVVEIAKPRDHSEATGKPLVVVSKFSDNTVTLGKFGDIDHPSYLKTVPVEILAKFPAPKYEPGSRVDINDGGTMIPAIVKSATLTEYGVYMYSLQSVNSENHSFNCVEERDLSPTPYTPPPLQIPPKFQGGDFVQVKRQRGHWTVELVYPLEPFQAEYQYDVRIDVGSLVNSETSYRLTVVESELELVEPSEEVKFQFEVGDYVRIKATGERRNIARDAGGDWWVLNGDLRYPTSQLEFISRPAVMQARSDSALQGAFYNTEEPALFDPELVMTRDQRNELMDCLYGGEAKGWEPETILYRIRELFPQPE